MADFEEIMIRKIFEIAEHNFLDAVGLSKALHQYLPGKDVSDHRNFLSAYGDLYKYIEENMTLKILIDMGFKNAIDVKEAGMKKILKIDGIGKLRARKIMNAVNGNGYKEHTIEEREERERREAKRTAYLLSMQKAAEIKTEKKEDNKPINFGEYVERKKMGVESYAITLRPEWAYAICNLGKNIENRTWTPMRSLSGKRKIAIHAGRLIGGRESYKAFLEGIYEVANTAEKAGFTFHTWREKHKEKDVMCEIYNSQESFCLCRDNIPVSSIVALAQVSEVRKYPLDTPWYIPGSWGWKLEEIITLIEPVPARGERGMWQISEREFEMICDQLGTDCFEVPSQKYIGGQVYSQEESKGE